MRRPLGLALALLGGCFSDTGGLPDTSSGSTTEATSADDETTGSSSSTNSITTIATVTTGDDTSTGEPPVGEPCDLYTQTCPDGQRCVPTGEDSSSDAGRCVPVTGDRLVGEPCTLVQPGLEGVDDCVAGALCWHVVGDAGVCVGLCEGAPDMPICASPDAACAMADGLPPLCLGRCDPLLQDCPHDDTCVPGGWGGEFLCEPDASGPSGVAFDPCDAHNQCDKGLLCLTSEVASECDADASGCCLPYCEVGSMMCPGAMQTCQAWYLEGTAPPGFEAVGVCTLPL